MPDDVIYLDNNATTRPYPGVFDAMEPFFRERFGNPSSVHQVGRDAKTALDDARSTVAGALNAASPAEVFFVSCATEANTLAIRGRIDAAERKTPHVVTSQIEHPSVLETLRALERKNLADVTFLPVDEKGGVSPVRVRNALRDDTVLVSIMTANNEVGTCQPMARISEICSEHGVTLHTDAVQAPAKIPINVQSPDVDLLSLSAHKFHGPRGIGVLYKRRDLTLEPVLRGGGQEREYRSGTESVALAVGLARAIERATEERSTVAERVDQLRRSLWEGVHDRFGERVERHTPLDHSLPNTLNVSFHHQAADKMMINLDLEGICVSAGSACHSGAIEISHVLEAMDVSRESAEGSVRFSFSHENTPEDVDRTLEVLEQSL